MTTLKAAEKESPEFDLYAASYEELLDDPLRNRFARDPIHFHRRKWLLIDRILNRAGAISKNMRWLDVGCGRGELLELAGRKFAQATGCDLSTGMLSSDVSFRTFVQPSPVDLPFADGSFDFLTVVCVLHHVQGPDRTLLFNEMRRVLSPGGFCCIIEHNPWNPITRAIVKRCPIDADAQLLTAGETGKLLENSGFISPTRRYFLYLPETLFYKFGAIEQVLSAVPLGGQFALLAKVPL